MQAAPLRVAETRMSVEQDADRLHRGETADPARHRAEDSVFGAGVAIVSVERVADEAAIAGVFG